MKSTPPNELNHEEKTKIHDFLDSHPVGVLATVDKSGNPHASTIFFTVDDDLNLMFTTKRDTHKHENIDGNSAVMLAVYDAESQTAVQVSGTAVEETDNDTIQKIYHGTLRATKRTSEDIVPPIAKIAAGPYVAYKVQPSDIWMSDYGWGDSFANAMAKSDFPADTNSPD